MAVSDTDLEQKLELLQKKYSGKFELILDGVDAMLKEAATQEYELRVEIAELKGLPKPPEPAMLTHWIRPSVFDPQQYLQSVNAELGRLRACRFA